MVSCEFNLIKKKSLLPACISCRIAKKILDYFTVGAGSEKLSYYLGASVKRKLLYRFEIKLRGIRKWELLAAAARQAHHGNHFNRSGHVLIWRTAARARKNHATQFPFTFLIGNKWTGLNCACLTPLLDICLPIIILKCWKSIAKKGSVTLSFRV